MTYLELVNELLALLREDEVSTVTENDYSTLISKFVNRAKYKVENAWTWSRLRSTIRIETTASVNSYGLTGAGKRYKILTDNDGKYDVWNDTEDYHIKKAPSSAWMSAMLNDDNLQTGDPIWFDINGYDENYDPIMDFYPVPETTQYINVNMYIPQAALSADTDVLIVPDEPVIMEAYLMALRERGEDKGTGYMEQREEARIILSDEITRDAEHFPEEVTWRQA